MNRDVVSAILNVKIENSTDATRGQPLAARVLARKDELEEALADLGPRKALLRASIETALATVNSLMTGLMTGGRLAPSEVIARDLNRWLERNKHLAQEVRRPRRHS